MNHPSCASRLITLSRCCFLGAVLATGCSSRSAGLPIWFGHVATLSGHDKQPGDAAARGIRLAVEEIDKDLDQGVGRPFKVIHCDTRGKLEEFQTEAVRLVAINRVSFLLGGTTTDELDRLDRARVPVVTPLGTRTRALSDAVFFTGLAPAQDAKVLAEFAVMELAMLNVVLIQDEREDEFVDFANTFAREFLAQWTKKDPKAVGVVRRLSITKDTQPGALARAIQEQSKLESGGAKAVIFAGKVLDLSDLGPLQVPLLFGGPQGAGPALAGLHGPGKEIYFMTPFTTDAADVPRAAEFAKRFREAFSEDADVHAALAYEGMKLLHEAIVRAKDNLTSGRVVEELKKLKDIAGLTGSLSFTPERQLRRPNFVMRIGDNGTKMVKRYNPEQ